MRRKALLLVTDCTQKTFETFSARGFLPFPSGKGGWGEYTLVDALTLRLLTELSKITTDLRTASDIAGAAPDMKPNPFWHSDHINIYLVAALFEYQDNDMLRQEVWTWTAREDHLREGYPAYKAPGYREVGILAVNATAAAKKVMQAARDLGLPEAKSIPEIPEDLTGYPEWFRTVEMARRELLNTWNNPDLTGGAE